MNTKEHYDLHLYKYYSWIYGGFKNKIEENLKFFKEQKIEPRDSKIVIDLGAGSGFQSIPLAMLGFNVKAIDFSRKLLAELKENSRGFDIKIIESDIMNFDYYSGFNPELIVCMGDTLTHLEDLNQVKNLITNSASLLNHNGKLILNFRDLSIELKDENRFIPVKSNNEKIFTCFLEYFPGHIKVHDIVNEKANGKWEQKISSYNKIKISEKTIRSIITENNLEIDFFDIKNGLLTLICVK